MHILFLTSSEEDYLSDGLLIGLRSLYGDEVVDYPKRDVLYASASTRIRSQIRGGGFTLYSGVLPDIDVDRFRIGPKLQRGDFDLVVVSDIWRQYGLFAQWRPFLNPANTVIMDGSDSPQVYPNAGLWWRRPDQWFVPRADTGFLYFKREWTERSRFNLWHRLLPKGLRGSLSYYRGLRRISFSIPESKIVAELGVRSKDFPRHIVDPEVAARVPGSSSQPSFGTEAEYYRDLQSSRFGVTTRRSGWDCLRHYEIAANGAVPCVRDLRLKPATCAPHGLVPGENCLAYASADELMHLTTNTTLAEWRVLAEGALRWARAHSSPEVAKRVISQWEEFRT